MDKAVTLRTTTGDKFIIDTIDRDKISKYNWYRMHAGRMNDYIYRVFCSNQRKRLVFLHRFLINALPGELVDHINSNGLDNRRSNLRIVTPAQNVMNKRKTAPRNTSSIYKGVCYYKNRGKRDPWAARIMTNETQYHLGYFKTQREAAIRYNEVALTMFGEFASLNKIR